MLVWEFIPIRIINYQILSKESYSQTHFIRSNSTIINNSVIRIENKPMPMFNKFITKLPNSLAR